MKYLGLSIFIFILSFLNILWPVEEAGSFVLDSSAIPFRSVALELEDYVSFMVQIKEIYSANQNLKEEVLSLQSDLSTLHELTKENIALKQQFLKTGEESQGEVTSLDDNLFLVSLLGNPNDLTNSTGFINAGSTQGVSKGAMVVYRNFLIGQVSEVERYRSLVNLVYSPDLRIPVTRFSLSQVDTGSPDNESAELENIEAAELDSVSATVEVEQISTEGIVVGDFGTSLKLERVLQKEPLLTGDLLVTSGREGFFKPGFIVGRVGDVYDEPTEPLKSAQVFPLLEIERLSKVFVFVEGDLK